MGKKNFKKWERKIKENEVLTNHLWYQVIEIPAWKQSVPSLVSSLIFPPGIILLALFNASISTFSISGLRGSLGGKPMKS